MKLLTKNQIDSFETFISTHDYFIIAGHKEPDGDCIASSIAIGEILKSVNKNYQLLNYGPFKRIELRKYEKMFCSQINKNGINFSKTGLIIVDCSEIFRVCEVDSLLNTLDTFIIDHHKTADISTSNAIIDPESPATVCIIQQIYESIVGKLDKTAAEIIFFGLSTDTGFFRFLDESSAEVFKATARLVESGVNPRNMYDYITKGKAFSTRKLLGTALDRAETYFNGKLVLTYETLDDTHKYGMEGRDSDSLYQLLLSVANVEAVVFMREETERKCTIGFRSRGEIDVSAIASVFGGGGHKNAAGASSEGNLQLLTQRIKEEFAKIL